MTARVCQAPGCGQALPGQRRRFCTDLCRRRGQRAERITETDEFGRVAVRMIAAMARRVGGSDTDLLGALWEVRVAADQAAFEVIEGLRAKDYSWAALAGAAGMTRQGLSQWHSRRAAQSDRNNRCPEAGAQ